MGYIDGRLVGAFKVVVNVLRTDGRIVITFFTGDRVGFDVGKLLLGESIGCDVGEKVGFLIG